MGELTRLYGKTPRVKVIEAFLRMAPEHFTRPQMAKETGLKKPSAYRALAKLERDGLIRRLSESPAIFAVDVDRALYRITKLYETALRSSRRSEAAGAKIDQTTAHFVARLGDETGRPGVVSTTTRFSLQVSAPFSTAGAGKTNGHLRVSKDTSASNDATRPAGAKA